MINILAATLLALAPVSNTFTDEPEPTPVIEEYFAITDNTEGQHGKATYVCDYKNEEGKYLVGSQVTVTINPSIFYDLKEKPTANVDLTQDDKNDKVYTFTMPNYDVNISYTFTLNNYIEDLKSNQYIGWIVTWVIDSGFLTALIIVVAKYRKYKSMTTDELNKVIQEKAVKEITKAVKELDETQLKAITKSIEDINAELDVLQKCFILAQDKSPSGKAALMEYLDANVKAKSKTEEDNKEVKEAIAEQKQDAEQTIEKEEKVLEKVKDDYQPVE